MKTQYTIILALILCSFTAYNQVESDISLREYFRIHNNADSYDSTTANYYSSQILTTIYPVNSDRVHMGIGMGYEFMKTTGVKILDSTISISEHRIPLMLVFKLDVMEDSKIYLKPEAGVALVLNSKYKPSNKPVLNSSIRMPALFNMWVGFRLLNKEKFRLNFEVGYGYKQLGYQDFSYLNHSSFATSLNFTFL